MGNSGFTTIDLIVLIVYLLAVLIAGLLFSKKEMQGKEFLSISCLSLQEWTLIPPMII